TRHLNEALSIADACAAPYERALTLLADARYQAVSGRSAEASALLTEVRAICAPLGAQPALAEADAISDLLARTPAGLPGGLTPREAEVLRLVARGLTDAAVADELSISPRTVG